MTEDIHEFVIQLLLEKGPLPGAEDVERYRYLDVGHIDSLGFIRFVFRIEERFNLRFSAEDISGSDIRTVGGLVKLIDARRLV